MIRRGLLILLLLACSSVHAKRFRNAYVSFELPPNWNCKLEGSEWVCENDFAGKTKEAIIILTAKEVGPADTLAAYLAHLQTPRTIMGRGGQQTKSQIIHVKERMINNQMWIDGLHLGSEVGPYYTRYMATIKDKIAILVTFSAHKEHFSKYSNDFRNALESLRVVASKDTLGDRAGLENRPSGNESYSQPPGITSTPYTQEALPEESRGGAKDKYFNWLMGSLILAAIGAYLYLKNKRKSQKPTKRPSGSSSSGGSKKAPKK